MSVDAITNACRQAGTAKEVARMTGRSPRTVERWQRGEAEPPASVIVTLMRTSREFAQTILAATGLTNEAMDAEEDRLIAELIALRVRRRADAQDPAPDGASGGADGIGDRALALAAGALSVSRLLRS
jgi:hypothetical protein